MENRKRKTYVSRRICFPGQGCTGLFCPELIFLLENFSFWVAKRSHGDPEGAVFENDPSARTLTVFFLLSGRRHLGGDIWKEASGKHLDWHLGSSLGAGAAMGASRASWTENAANSLCFTAKMKKTRTIISLRSFGGRCHDCMYFTAT